MKGPVSARLWLEAASPATVARRLVYLMVRVAVGDEAANLKARDSCSCLVDTMHLFDNARGDVEALTDLVVKRC